MSMEMKQLIHDSLEKLWGLGIDGRKAEDKISKGILDMPDEILEAMEKEQIIGMILSSAWRYDEKRESAGIYSFDVECGEIEQMYTLFLQNIEQIAKGDLRITDIEEEVDEEVLERGRGKKAVRFCCNGTAYQYDAEVDYDWFDTGMLEFIGQVVQEQHTGSYLYVTGDGYQECIILYRTGEWAQQFEQALGIKLECL